MKTKVRELRPGDMDSFVELCDSRDQLDRAAAERRAEVVEWVAFHNPCDDGNPTYFVGAQGDRVMAHLGRMPCVFQLDGVAETASYFHDLYVHPELRTQQASGFFLSMKMYRKCEKASKSFCAMIWTNEINISLQKARKYRQMWTDRRVLLLGIREKLDRRLPKPAVAPISTAARAVLHAGNWANNLRLRTNAQVERLDRFDEGFDELVTRTAHSLGIAPRKDHVYLNWKYIDRPHIDAVVFQLLDESAKLAGFCVVINPDSSRTAAIAELVVVDRDREGIHALLGAAIEYLETTDADRIEAASSDPVYATALHERLFRRDLRIPLFLAHSDRSPSARLLHSPSNWHVSLGDSEGPF